MSAKNQLISISDARNPGLQIFPPHLENVTVEHETTSVAYGAVSVVVSAKKTLPYAPLNF